MIKKASIKKIKSIVGIKYVKEHMEDRICYSFDATPRMFLPELVVSPGTTKEISDIVKLAALENIPVIPRGAGTGFVGGSLTVQGGISLCCARMKTIAAIDEENLTAIVEPGVVNFALQCEAEKRGLFYPPDPSSLTISTLGGNASTCAGGPRAVKYGVTKDYVMGMEVVLADGSILNTGGMTLKGVVGYDLTKLIVGSEGTLGIISKLILRLIPKPPCVQTIFVCFPHIEDAANSVIDIMGAKITPSCLEFMDKEAVRCIKNFLDIEFETKVEAVLLIEVDGEETVIEDQKGKIVSILNKNRASNIQIAKTDEEREKLWRARRALSPAMKNLNKLKINEDIAVPRSAIAKVIKRLSQISKTHGIMIVNFGHAGDGNIHVNILIDEQDEKQVLKKDEVVQEVFNTALEYGGTISGEHGVGITKMKYVEKELGLASVNIMKKIKNVFDPQHILNPGKVFLP